MKTIHTDGISYIEPVPGGTSGWYFGVSLEHGDLYEAEEICSDGFPVEGNSLVLIRYPDGAVFRPLPKQAGTYSDTPVFLDGSIFCLNVDFLRQLIRIVRFDCKSGEVRTEAELPLGAVKNCYNLKLHTSPLCLTRQGDDDVFEILTAPNDFSTVRENLEKQGITFLSAEVAKIPQNTVAVSDPDTILKIQKMLDLLEENDDVQNVFHNADLPDEEEDE